MKTTIMFFFLLVLPITLFAGTIAPYKCEKDVVALPIEVFVKSPRLDYVGKYSDGRPVFYQTDSMVFYVFASNFATASGEKMPSLFQWRAPHEKRPTAMFAGGSDTAWAWWSSEKGLKDYLLSLHVKCESSDEIDSNSPNRELLKTAPGSCLGFNSALSTGLMKKCCKNLELNPNTVKCDQVALVDPEHKSCLNHTECDNNMGCYPQRSGDLFQSEGADDLADIVNAQVDNWELNKTTQDVNASCSHARECKSYTCYGGKCINQQICRLADKNETAPGFIKCKEGLEKDQYSKCIEGEGYLPFVGMLDSMQFELQGQCGFSIDKDQKAIIAKAMRSARALEWITTRISVNDPGDCFKMAPWLRDKIGKEMFTARQTLIANFSRETLAIETDYATLLKAKAGSNTQTSMHGIVITEDDIASRQSGGWDSLMLMYRKNALYRSYEKAMMDLTLTMADKMTAMAIAVSAWQDDAQVWTYGDASAPIEKFNCQAKYESFDFWGQDWDTVYHDKTKDRWMTFYDVKMNNADNKEIIDKPAVREMLMTVHQKDESVIVPMYSANHGLMDPLNWGSNPDAEMQFEKFGDKVKIEDKKPEWQESIGKGGTVVVRGLVALSTLGLSELFGFFNTTREVRYYRTLDGSNNGTYKAIHATFKPSILEYYKALKVDAGQTNFAYEPEITDPQAKDCANADKIDSTVCAPFKTYLDELQDISFAQFLTYSYKTKDDYKNYFRNPDQGRLMLFSRWATDLHNLNVYYNDIVGKRDKQNECISTLIDNIENNFDNGTGGGINFAGGNYGNGTGGNEGGEGHKSTGAGPRGESSSLDRFNIDLMTGKPVEYQSANFDSVVSTPTAGSGSATASGYAAAAIAKRRAKMDAANARAVKKGVNLVAREAAVRKALGLSASGAGPVAGAGGNHGGNQGGAGSGNTATISAETTDAVAGPTGELVNGQNGAGGGSANFSSGSSLSNASGRDSTGMSDEEKTTMLSNLERTKSQYNPDEYDGLFKIVSKAYVRNLEKILTRKKEGE